jgi:hypothetical protein
MEVESAPLAVWESGKNESIKPAVKEAAKHGADAVVLVTSGTNVTGYATFNSANWASNTSTTGGIYGNNFRGNTNTRGSSWGTSATMPMPRGYATAIAIKFL